jgi:4-azaleucine resistance transporter AzlC
MCSTRCPSPLHRVEGKAGKTYSTFALTDEAYALTASETARSWPGRRILWLQAFIHAYWVTGATTGAALGTVISAHIAGLNFAMTALFAVLAIDAFRARRDIPAPVLALAATLGLHLWRRNAVLSILGGTAIHVALATGLPAL